MSRDALTILCPAKVNLALSVGAPDAHTGMHPICSWMVAVSFTDTLVLTRAKGDDSSYEVCINEDAPSVQQIDWPIESDLAFRAHQILQQHIGEDLPVDMKLIKRIPTGAGLGGGSSDAAGMLTGLNDLFSLGLNDEHLIRLGLRLGSDVGFLIEALSGNPSAVVGGYGEWITPVAILKEIDIVLIFPPCHCGTADVYRRFDEHSPNARLQEDRVKRLVNDQSSMSDELFNDLAEPAFQLQPVLRDWHNKLEAALNRPVHVSGSGASMFILTDSAAEAEAIRMQVVRDIGLPAVATVARG